MMPRSVGPVARWAHLYPTTGAFRVRLQNPAQVLRAQGHHMVGTLTPDRPNQPLGVAVLPRRAMGNGLVADAHGPQSAHHRSAIDPVLIADQGIQRRSGLLARSARPTDPIDLCVWCGLSRTWSRRRPRAAGLQLRSHAAPSRRDRNQSHPRSARHYPP